MKIGIIGGGASGMLAAISAARCGANVMILEGGERIGRKILATGNGKCNFTNKKMDHTCFRSNTMDDITPFLERFGNKETLDFFASIHMLYKEKNGYYYPASEQASTVLDVLRFAIEGYGEQIQVLTEHKVRSINRQQDGRIKVMCGTQSFVFDRVILACGSKAAPKTGSDGTGYQLLRGLKCGCRIEEPVPALVQLRCQETGLKAVSGVRAEGCVSLWADGECVAEEHGEIQLTDYGVSGIPVFQVSRFASYACLHGKKVQVCLDFMPGMDQKEAEAFLHARRKLLGGKVQRGQQKFTKKMTEQETRNTVIVEKESCNSAAVMEQEPTMEHFCAGLIHKKLCQYFCRLAGISMETPISAVSDKAFSDFVGLCKAWTLRIEKPNGFDMAQICAGGLSMQEIDENFALKKCPAVYVVGELLDVDGICGGYNLQWAWTSGYLAGRHAAGGIEG